MYASQAYCKVPVAPTIAVAVENITPPNEPVITPIMTVPARDANKKQGSRLLSKLFNKKESKSPEPPKLSEKSHPNSVDASNEQTLPSQEQELRNMGIVQPCPFIRPLGHKLEARVESSPFGRGGSSAIPSSDSTVLQNPQYRFDRSITRASYVSDSECGDAVDEPPAGITEAQNGHYYPRHVDYSQEELEAQIKAQIRFLATQAAESADYIHHWEYWLKLYANGQHNLSRLAPPPNMHPYFSYLPAIPPPNETMRYSISEKYGPTWDEWGAENLKVCLDSLRHNLGVQCAVITCFDDQNEYVRAGVGYHAPVNRLVSIGAHALLTTDMMVVGDTYQDWRFRGNPLVTGEHDEIRFFAAVPLLSPTEHAIGVLAVFDDHSRDTFAEYERALLRDMGRHIMGCLNQLVRPTASLQLEPNNEDCQKAVVSNPFEEVDLEEIEAVAVEHAIRPLALRSQNSKTPPTASTGVLTEPKNSDNFYGYSDETPPPSINSTEDIRRNALGLNSSNMELVVKPGFENFTSRHDLVTPDSDDYRSCSPRPWSSSDITSLHPHPPNTPAFSLREEFEQNQYSLTVEDFLKLRDDDCAEEQPDQDEFVSQENDVEDDRHSEDRAREIHQMRPLLGSPTQSTRLQSKLPFPANEGETLPPLPKLPTRAKVPSAPNTPPYLGTPEESIGEAAFAFADTARNLGYDLIYAVELRAEQPGMTIKELEKPGAMKFHVIAAYGLTEPLEFDVKQHLCAVRSRGTVTWDNPHPRPGDYLYGLLQCVSWTEGGPRSQRSNGTVICAYRLPGRDARNYGDAVDVQSFQQAIEVLTRILIPERAPKLQIPQVASDEAPDSPRYPANEAQEVQSPSSDSSPISPRHPRPNNSQGYTRFGYRKR